MSFDEEAEWKRCHVRPSYATNRPAVGLLGSQKSGKGFINTRGFSASLSDARNTSVHVEISFLGFDTIRDCYSVSFECIRRARSLKSTHLTSSLNDIGVCDIAVNSDLASGRYVLNWNYLILSYSVVQSDVNRTVGNAGR
jgi:hypothetical protein